MQVSILVPVLNERAILKTQLSKLESARSQSTAPHFIEVLICDAGSDDGSLKVLSELEESLSNTTVIKDRLEKPSIASTFALGLSQARGILILLLPLDCHLDSQGINEVLDLSFTTNAEQKWGAFLKIYDKQSLPLLFSLWIQNFLRSKIFKDFLWTNGFFLGKNLLKEIQWPEEPFLNDLILCDRLKKLAKAKLYPTKSFITVDSRNYQKHFGLLKMLSNTLIVALYRSRRVSPTTLKRIYKLF